MSSSCIFPSVATSHQKSVISLLSRDFVKWLMALHSGNDSAATASFAALKSDFQNSSQTRTRKNVSKLLHESESRK